MSDSSGKAVYLHIGLPKTATSYLQNLIRAHRDDLMDQGVWIPARPLYAHRMAAETMSGVRAEQADVENIKTVALQDALEDLKPALTDSRFSHIVLSSEYFSLGSADRAKALISAQTDLPVRIVLYLRRQDYLTESGYNQDIKAMGSSHPLGDPKYSEHLDWERLLEHWAAAFGPAAIRAIGYDRAARDGAVQRSFFEALDAGHVLDNGELAHDGGAANASLPADLLEFKRLANSFGEFGLDKWLSAVAETGHWAPKYRMSADMSEQYRALYEESNRRVVAKYFNGDADALALDEAPAAADRGVDYTGALPVDTLARLFAINLKQSRRREELLRQRVSALEAQLGITSESDK